MTFFVDANVIVYAATRSDYRAPCLRILEAIAGGEVDGRTSPAALEEVWYIERSGKAGRLDGLAAQAYKVFTPLLPVTDDAFRLALGVRKAELGPADRLHVGTCWSSAIDTIVSADSGFGRVRGLRRVDPLDPAEVGRLLEAD
ncbi:MAG: type II toxin-antitoxin system VapC family toxin [Actinobacteria bacterium]|nr:type II toxin-antitoxin system VapC family toxin [Actinomycetota bacterium]